MLIAQLINTRRQWTIQVPEQWCDKWVSENGHISTKFIQEIANYKPSEHVIYSLAWKIEFEQTQSTGYND
jgi:hypothetical protein